MRVLHLDEEGEETHEEFNEGFREGDRHRVMVGRNVNHHGYGERQNYRVKAGILTLLEILTLRQC